MYHHSCCSCFLTIPLSVRSEATKAKAELQLEEATMIEKAIDRALAAVDAHVMKHAKVQREAAEAAAGAPFPHKLCIMTARGAVLGMPVASKGQL